MPDNQEIDVTSDELYRINDVVSALANEFNIAGRRQFDTDEEFDDLLNDTTHAIVALLFG